jgi:BirA family biotin operon repressor/biotin-[acetyl-CoA-carboxylase] ligase
VDLGAEGSIEGVAVGIDDDGHLVVVDDDGASHTVAVGDVVHLRPAG